MHGFGRQHQIVAEKVQPEREATSDERKEAPAHGQHQDEDAHIDERRRAPRNADSDLQRKTPAEAQYVPHQRKISTRKKRRLCVNCVLKVIRAQTRVLKAHIRGCAGCRSSPIKII